MVINWDFHSSMRITCECDIGEMCVQIHWFVSKNVDAAKLCLYHGLAYFKLKMHFAGNRMRMRSPSSMHCTLFVIALTLIGRNKSISSIYLSLLSISCYSRLSSSSFENKLVVFIMREKSIGKSQPMPISTMWSREGERTNINISSNSKNAICVTVFLSRTEWVTNEKKTWNCLDDVHRPKWCEALFKSSFFIHKTRASASTSYWDQQSESERGIQGKSVESIAKLSL